MEAEASGLADQAFRVQQQAARRSWRAWLEENTTEGAAKVHQLIREPIGFQTARGNAVDEQLKLCETWAAIWRANAVEPAFAWPEDNGPLFPQPSVNAMRRVLASCHGAWVRCGTAKDAERAGADCACLSVQSKPLRGGGQQAQMASCSTAKLKQREHARPWTAVKGPSGAAVATLARMQWTIFEHDLFLWCMHDGRIVDPRRVCPQSMRILLKHAARTWQWLRVALHEGYEGALCGSEEGSLIHRHFRCSEVQDGEPSNMLGPFHVAAQSGALWKHESFAARALQPALRGRPAGYTVPYETGWTGDRSVFTGVVCGDGSAYEGQDADLYLAGWGLVANTSIGQPVTVSGTLPFLIQDVDGAELFGLFMFLRIARAPAQHVTDSSFVEQGVDQRGRSATEASTSAWADLWRDVWCEIDAWRGLGDNFATREASRE